MLACHAGGRGFESRPLRQLSERAPETAPFFCVGLTRDDVWRRPDASAVPPRQCAVNCAATSHQARPMLQKLRDKTSGWIATVVLGLLIVPFAFFGMEQYMFQGNDRRSRPRSRRRRSGGSRRRRWWPVTMLWQREEIDSDEFRDRVRAGAPAAAPGAGRQFDPREFETHRQQAQGARQLVDQRVLRMAAKRAGIAVSDAQVRDDDPAIPAFQVDGKFDAAALPAGAGLAGPGIDAASVRADACAKACSSRWFPRQVADSGIRHRTPSWIA